MPTQSDPGSLDEFALRAGADIRSPLLWTLVDLYLQKPTHTGEETRHFTELMLRLLDQADAATRIAISRRLAPYPAVPQLITQRLAADLVGRAALSVPPNKTRKARFADKPLASEPESIAELSELFFSARSAERRLILLNLGYGVRTAIPALSGDAHEAAHELETAALSRKPDAFMRTIERWLGITPALAWRIVNDPFGEPIVVVAKAIGIAPDAVQRILLFINPVIGRSISRVFDLAALFESIDAKAAHTLVRIWRAADPPPIKRPATWPTPIDRADQRVRRGAAGSTATEERKKAGATSSSAQATTARYRGTGSSGP
jgi:hypothetical protein